MKKLFLFVLIVGLLSSCNWKKDAKTATDPCPEKTAMLLSLQAQVTNLQSQVLTLTTENGRLQGLLDCLETKVTITKVTAKSNSNTAKKAATPKVSTASSGKATSNTTKSAAVPEPIVPGRPSNANLSGLRENGIISFCVMGNGDKGLHFPQKALDKNVTFTSVETNPSNDGHNWIVEPVEFIEGDYGLTVDGTFFVSNDMMVKVLQPEGIVLTSVKIKAPFTNWQERDMYLRDGVWLYDALK
jgi:hypothetical protein